MKGMLFNITGEYDSALRHYLNGGGEEALRRAYELGRTAIGEEIGSMELVHVHQKVLLEILRTVPSIDRVVQITESASRFFAEVLSSYEMTFFGYRDALNTVRQSGERYRMLIDTARDVIYTLSRDGILKSLNPVFETITGWSRSEWIGKPFAPLVHPDDLPFALATHERVISGESPIAFEIRIRKKSGEYVVGEFTTTPEYHDGQIVGTFGIARDISERKRAQEQLKALTNRVVEAQEEERRRLSRELHDDLCQWLSGMKLSFGLLEEQLSGNKSMQTTIRRLKRQTNDRIVEVRRMSTNLRPAALDDFGLDVALKRLCEDYGKIHALEITFDKENLSLQRYPAEKEIAVYRITQEALSNVVKHARATRARVSLLQTDTSLVLEVHDNGVGLSPNRAGSRQSQESGLGLISMKERTEILGGAFEIDSTPGNGTTVRAQVPLT